MFNWLIEFINHIDTILKLIVEFWHRESNFIIRFILIYVIILPVLWSIPIFDVIINFCLSFFEIFFNFFTFILKGISNFIKFIFGIKPKTFYLKQGNIKIIFESDINGKLKIIKKEILPINQTNQVNEYEEITLN